MNAGRARMLAVVLGTGLAGLLAGGEGRAGTAGPVLTPTWAVSLVQSAAGRTGTQGVRCAATRRSVCTVIGAVTGTGRSAGGGQTWQLMALVPRGVEPGAVAEAVFSTSKGLEGLACDPVRSLRQSTVS